MSYLSAFDIELLPLTPNAFLHSNVSGEIAVKTDSGRSPVIEPSSMSKLLDGLTERETLVTNFE